MGLVLGIDVSTTATKAVLVDETGRRPRRRRRPSTGSASPRPLWSEQDPALWWDGAVGGDRRRCWPPTGATGEDVVAVGLTGQMHGLVLLDAARRGPPPGDPVERPADRRRVRRDPRGGRAGAADRDHRQRRPDRASPRRSSSGSATTSRTSGRAVGARAAAQGLPAAAADRRARARQGRRRRARCCSTSRPATGRPRCWRALGIDPAWLPPTFEGPEVTGTVTAAAAAATGLACRHAGRGRRRRPVGQRGRRRRRRAGRRWRCRSGTSGVVFAATDRPLYEPRGPRPRLLPRRARSLAHDVGDALGGRQPALVPRRAGAGRRRSATSWPRPPTSPAGSDGLLFLPYLTGERSPHPDPLARGAFVGLTAGPRPAPPDAGRPRGRRLRPARRARPDARGRACPRRDQIRASGGGTASPLWRQILADVLGAEIATVGTTEGAAYGAGAAGRASARAGSRPSTAATDAVVTATPVATPGPDASAYAERARALSRAVSRRWRRRSRLRH